MLQNRRKMHRNPLLFLLVCLSYFMFSETVQAGDPQVEEISEGSKVFATEELPRLNYIIGWKEERLKQAELFAEDFLAVDTRLLDRDTLRRLERLSKARGQSKK